jgi:hypothetical protein
MIRRGSILLILGSVFAAVCWAQHQQPANPPATNQQPATTANGQTSPPAGSPPGKTEKTKKVWTNDEVATLPGTVSVVGKNGPAEKQTQSAQHGSGAAADARRGKVQRYRAAIADLRKKIDAADQKISQLTNFKANDSSPSGGINPNRGYNMIPLDEQVKQLEAKKKQLLANIEDLEIQAEKEGIEPGELR